MGNIRKDDLIWTETGHHLRLQVLIPSLTGRRGNKVNFFNGQVTGLRIDPATGTVLQKILATTAIAGIYCLLNFFLRIHLPGVSNVDIRPQIVLLFAAGYFLGPGYGFLAGFAGNFLTDIFLGNGLTYLPTWTIGNGLVGALTGFFSYRKQERLDSLVQLVWLVVTLLLVNVISLSYAAGLMNLLESDFPLLTNIRYFFLPALISNVMSALVLFPGILFLLGRMKPNYPIKLSLANYYLTLALLIVSWVILFHDSPDILALSDTNGMDLAAGNAFVEKLTYWSLLFLILLMGSFLISSWMSKQILHPLTRLEETVFMVLNGNPDSVKHLLDLSRREDEIGVLSYSIRLLSEKLWESQKRFRDDLEKNMPFLDPSDSGTDILVISLISLFGKDISDQPTVHGLQKTGGQLSNLSAIALLISACGLEELAGTYTDAKIETSLEGMNEIRQNSAMSRKEKQALALAIDMKLLFKGRLLKLDLHTPINRDLSFHLLERAQSFRKSSRNYIGFLTEPDIVNRILNRWERMVRTRNDKLESVMNAAIGKGLITGYQLKALEGLADFDPVTTISYSHRDIRHIIQLIGLLMTENLQAKVQLEPKLSVYYYPDTWDPIEERHLSNFDTDKKVAMIHELDLLLEFMSLDHRNRFHPVIDRFAKQEQTADRNILFGSWHNPLFRSNVPIDGYHRLSDIGTAVSGCIAHTYVREEESAGLEDWLRKNFDDLDITISPIWVNDDFFRYLNGMSRCTETHIKTDSSLFGV